MAKKKLSVVDTIGKDWRSESRTPQKRSRTASDGYVHLSEAAIDMCAVTQHIKVEAKYKVLRRFMEPGDSVTKAFSRMVDYCIKDVRLTVEDLAAVNAEIKENYEKRMARRAVQFGDSSKRKPPASTLTRIHQTTPKRI